MFRQYEGIPWQLIGSGSILGSDSNSLLTAYHLFAGLKGQFGYRRIGPKEFTGLEKISPILSHETLNAEHVLDAAICVVEDGGNTFPIIDMPNSEKVFTNFGNTNYDNKLVSADIRIETEPEKLFEGFLRIHVKRGCEYVAFSMANIVPGESGTVATIAGQDKFRLVITGDDNVTWGSFTGRCAFGYVVYLEEK
jgi:hypothetical protein